MSDQQSDPLLHKIYELISLAESGEDYDQALTMAVAYTKSSDPSLRMNALHSFGYIARVYGRLDLSVALPLLRRGEKDADPEVAAAARDALDDLGVFLRGFKA